jgi:hypothetical protein
MVVRQHQFQNQAQGLIVLTLVHSQVNTDAGFSIVTYTGRADEITVHQQTNLTHGLGVAPDFTINEKTRWHR